MDIFTRIKRRIEKGMLNGYYKSHLNYPFRSYEAINYLVEKYRFSSVLDIGCGQGVHSDFFLNNGKNVTAIDYGKSDYFQRNEMNKNIKCIIADFNDYDFADERYDCIWCSHVLEHQLNVQVFLEKLHQLLNEGGY